MFFVVVVVGFASLSSVLRSLRLRSSERMVGRFISPFLGGGGLPSALLVLLTVVTALSVSCLVLSCFVLLEFVVFTSSFGDVSPKSGGFNGFIVRCVRGLPDSVYRRCLRSL